MGMHGVFTSPEKMRIPTEKNTCLTQELANALTIEIRHIYMIIIYIYTRNSDIRVAALV